MAYAIYPKYSEFYSGQKPDLSILLQEIPSIHIISFACYINAIKHREPHNLQLDLGLFKKLIKNQMSSHAIKLDSIMSDFITKLNGMGVQTLIFPPRTVMRLIQFEIENWKSGNFHKLSPANEENILKAILILNQIEEESFLKDVKDKKAEGVLETFITYMWPNLLPTMEFQLGKEIILPLTYSAEFFRFLNAHPKLQTYLKKYVSNNHCDTWQQYLQKLALFYVGGLNKEDNWFFFRIDAGYIENMSSIEGYILDMSNFNIASYYEEGLNINFKLLREKPIMKLANGFYVMTNWNFFLEKLYNSQKFDFYKYSGVQELYPGDNDKKWQAYNGDLGNFSEKNIFLKLAHRYFSQEASAIIEEDSKKNLNQDLYYRFQNQICFIEYKAVFLPISYTFDEIKVSIDDPTKLLKSIKQLATQIISFAQNINKFENLQAEGFSNEHLIVYPLVVYADENWSMYGIRDYYNQILKNELAKQELKFFKVEDLVLMHIDVLSDFEKLFLEDKLPLTEILKQHNKAQQWCSDKYKNHPDQDNLMHMYADANVFLVKAFPGRFTHSVDSTFFRDLLKELGMK